jgi:integrase
LKKPYHARLVPIHKKLIELGFIKFVEYQKKNKHQRLFPELPFVSNSNKYGDKLQRWFNRTYKNSCQIKTVNASFHSLRHTVITHLVNDKKIDPNRIAIGFGQTPIGGVTQTVYTKRQSAMSYYQYFDLVDFSDCFDLKKIRGWTYHLFNRPEMSKSE